MVYERMPVPLDTVKAVIERRNAGMKNPSIEVNSNGDIIPRSPGASSDYTISVRPSTRAGPPEQSSRAHKLKACKGTKGCEFVQCVEKAMGKVPKNLQKLKDRCTLDNNTSSRQSNESSEG